VGGGRDHLGKDSCYGNYGALNSHKHQASSSSSSSSTTTSSSATSSSTISHTHDREDASHETKSSKDTQGFQESNLGKTLQLSFSFLFILFYFELILIEYVFMALQFVFVSVETCIHSQSVV
jgi:hypothetical protein